MTAIEPPPLGRRARQSQYLFLILALLVGGCGGPSSVPKTFTVTGKVTFKGGGLYPGGTIQFTPVTDTSLTVTGVIKDDGTFTLYTIKGNTKVDGAPAGAYRVTVLPALSQEDHSRAPKDKGRMVPIVLTETFRVEARDAVIPIEVPAPAGKP